MEYDYGMGRPRTSELPVVAVAEKMRALLFEQANGTGAFCKKVPEFAVI